ncbi:MAG: flagellar filament capping protein FliD, partial [Burkholderiales bacterium]|nr:flagellar filament capping protein FliD [Burkholderiales bacterium]
LTASSKSQKLIDSNGNTLVDLSRPSELSGNGADLATQINAKIASSSLNGKVSATYVGNSAGDGSIKFTNLTTDTTIKYSDSTPTVTQINSGISLSSKLASSGLNIVANSTIITATNLISAKNPQLIAGTTLTLSRLDGLTGADLAAKINSDIAADSNFKDKISAEYVKDANGNDAIKFTNLTTTSVTYNDTASGSTSFNGGNMSFALSDGSNTYNVSLAVDGNTTMQNLIDAVNSATSGAITMKIDDNTGGISFQSKSSGSTSSIGIVDTSTGSNNLSALGISLKSYTSTANNYKRTTKLVGLGFEQETMKFTVNNKSVSLVVNSSTSMSDLESAVNTSVGAGTMNVDGTGKVVISSGENITINNGSSNDIIKLLGLNGLNTTGADAVVSIKEPGQSSYTTTTQSSNNFTVNGVSYNLLGVSSSSSSTGDANITVTANSDTVVSNVKKFIEDYNTIISTINTKLTEKKDSTYAPLTDAQKESMSESQITAWETKAKVGILKNDDYLQTLMTQLRGTFSPVYSSYTSASTNTGISLSFGSYGTGAIGIDTSTDYTDGGKLVIKDEAKLKSAIENNFDDFKKLFIGASGTTLGANQAYNGSNKYNEDGIFTRMDNILRDYVAAPGVGKDGTYTLSGSMNIFVNKQYDYSITGFSGKNTLPDQVYSKTVSISKYETQLKDAQTRYYAKFTALETAMNTLNSQQSQLSSMLGTS